MAIKVTAEMKAEGAKIAKDLKVKSLFVNTKGEFFTEENRASLSEKGIADNYEKLSFTDAPAAKPAKVEEK